MGCVCCGGPCSPGQCTGIPDTKDSRALADVQNQHGDKVLADRGTEKLVFPSTASGRHQLW